MVYGPMASGATSVMVSIGLYCWGDLQESPYGEVDIM